MKTLIAILCFLACALMVWVAVGYYPERKFVVLFLILGAINAVNAFILILRL